LKKQAQYQKISSVNNEQFKNDFENTFLDNSLASVIVERRKISGKFWKDLDLKNFPVVSKKFCHKSELDFNSFVFKDVQELSITLTTPRPANEMEIIHSKTKFSTINTKCFVDTQQWHLYGHITVKEFLRESAFSTETYPAINFSMNAARRPSFYILNTFLIVFLITASSLSLFSMRCHKTENRLQTLATILLASITLKWTMMTRALPTVSYMTFLDIYSLSNLVFLMLQFFWHSTISTILDNDSPKCVYPYSKYDATVFFTFLSIFLVFNCGFMAMIALKFIKKRLILNKQENDFTNAIVGKRSNRLKSMLYGI
jgi:hypothetical protein